MQGPTRPLEGRLSLREADSYRPFAPRTGPPPQLPLRTLARLEQQGERRRLAAALLLRANVDQATVALSHEPPSPERDNDLALAAWAQGRYAEALELLEEILTHHPAHPQALFNTGLVLRDMELPLLAAATFDRVASLGEPGWSEEARRLAVGLREPVLTRGRQWREARNAYLRLLEDPQAPLPLRATEQFPATARALLQEAARASLSREQVLRLLPLAEMLERHGGDGALRQWVVDIAGRDFSHRAPLARAYALLVLERHPFPELFAEQILYTSQEDLAFGVIGRKLISAPHVEPLLAMRWGAPQPELALQSQREQAHKANREGRWREEEQHLLALLRDCERRPPLAACLEAERALATLYTTYHLLAEAAQYASSSRRHAQALGEWIHERASLHALAQLARFRMQPAAGRAYLEEALLRGPEGCTERNYLHRNLASFSFANFRLEQARRDMDEALACGQPVGLFGAWILGELTRLVPRPGDGQSLRRALEEVRRLGDSPGRQAYALYIEGRFILGRDKPAGRKLLRQAIEAAQQRPRSDTVARTARDGSYTTLISEAGQAGAWDEALALSAEALELPVPTRCALAVALDMERTVVVAQGPQGEPRGSFDASRRAPLGEDVSHLVPAALVQHLRACEQVEVLALAPVDSRPGILPADMAWSYRATRLEPGPSASSAPLQLVVTDVEAPGELRLPRLRAWPSEPATGVPRVTLSGIEATPSRVLAAMGAATEIEIHAHGLVDPSVSIASLVALAPEPEGTYALTAGEVYGQRLTGRPVVLLAACGAARTSPFPTGTLTLPKAFVAAGARAVFASAVDIPDSAGIFFGAVHERLRAGTPPALALREERRRWLAHSPKALWVLSVLLYE
ncbi:MAG: CHAT domain-containing protein [Myxococcaceae bacterium]|nr:CHAT domain-containing protein [Myxococcaceae bacterium]